MYVEDQSSDLGVNMPTKPAKEEVEIPDVPVVTDEPRIQSTKGLQFIHSGSTILDLALNGGWCLGRVFNIVGDKSTGKTLLAIEAFANFHRQYPKGRMRYAEAEAAFDDAFAEQLGFPAAVERSSEMIRTVEDFKVDLGRFIAELKEADVPGIYVLDSLDSLSSDAELANLKLKLAGKEEKGSYGVEKPKEMSQLFRQMSQDVEDTNCALGIISQIRDNIGVTWGEGKTRSGGNALDFYSSQVLWLYERDKIERQIKGQKRVVGINVESKVKKLKVGYPFRIAKYAIYFGYGIDDEDSMLTFLHKDLKAMTKEAYDELWKQLSKARDVQDYNKISEIHANLKRDCIALWNEIENELKPTIRKYR